MRRFLERSVLLSIVALIALAWTSSVRVFAQEKPAVIPHAQDKPPNEPRDPQTAAKMMTVPEGFSVEVVAAEPDIVNPVAMTIDERGRFWITESLEYPRKSAGPGKDRVKILEDTDGDGKCDKFTVFLDGLNIPSGIAVGHGGVWIANSPDILFVPDADRDGVPDGPPQVVVTGFGRTDTHELPNSLTWGPDGWLYGLNGVFNYSKVTYPPDSPWLKHVAHAARVRGGERSEPSDKNKEDKNTGTRAAYPTEFTFTCAMFRIHPRTREFQIFAEGTSNPWGIAFNDEGEAFISACVIDHLWHIVETGYYHRQGGPYPPFTWKIDSIVKHKHQKAAYCGIHYFDSDAYPEQYRGKLYMGNIHGGCINVDKLQRDGSTYFATGEPDFLTANDAWFMPVVQKTGPDGCLYILDWYDRYHCYQDANRDPAGIDRLKGRLYRVRYKDSPRTPKGFDLAKETDKQLIERLGEKNDFTRWTATRLLQERLKGTFQEPSSLETELRNVVKDEALPRERRLAAFRPFMLLPDVIREESVKLTRSKDEVIRAAALRYATNTYVPNLVKKYDSLELELTSIMQDNLLHESPIVRRQALIYITRLCSQAETSHQLHYLIDACVRSGNDAVLQRLTWQAIKAYAPHDSDFLGKLLMSESFRNSPVATELVPRIIEWILGQPNMNPKDVASLFGSLRDEHPVVARNLVAGLATKIQSGELKGEKLDQLKAALAELLTPLLADGASHPLGGDAALLAVSWGDPRGLPQVRHSFATAGLQPDLRLKALYALIAAKDEGVLAVVGQVLDDKSQISNLKSENPNLKSEILNLKSQLLTALGRLDDPKVADVVLTRFASLEPELQPSAVELLTQRASWSKQLLSQVGEKKIAATAINVNQARRIQALKDKELNDLLSRHWGQVRDTRNPDREKVVAEMKSLIRQKPGDPFAGEKVFKRVCAACHKIYGEGPDIGPDITSNGRNDFNQLLSNVFDPSLVIGAGYRVCTVVNKAGRVQSGLLVEDSPQRVVLKPAVVGGNANASRGADSPTSQPVTVAVGKLEIIPRDDIDEFKINELSLMPEGLEKQLSPQEIVDLFAFLVLDKHPKDKSAKQLPGVTP